MEIKILELPLYVEKFHERLKPGCHYDVTNRVIYRSRLGESEDIGELPPDLESVSLPPVDFAGGQFVGDADAAARLRAMARDISALLADVRRLLQT